jgi:hypothetical protein
MFDLTIAPYKVNAANKNKRVLFVCRSVGRRKSLADSAPGKNVLGPHSGRAAARRPGMTQAEVATPQLARRDGPDRFTADVLALLHRNREAAGGDYRRLRRLATRSK